MEITGIICEYNPFHLGHYKQFSVIRENNPDCAIVCLMSGNYVQRGMPAIYDKEIRAKAAMESGADLVLELPVTAALSSAEGFAAEGVQILSGFCNKLSFGAESPNIGMILQTAQTLLSETFKKYLRTSLSEGLSFPAARQRALEAMGGNSDLLQKPNNILAVEYCKAILSQNSPMAPQPILRGGDFHDQLPDAENPSATSLRRLIEAGCCCFNYVPPQVSSIYQDAAVHTLSSAERAILYRLKTMSDEDFSSLPFGSEGLWRKLMKNARQYTTLEQIIVATKSKRYTRTRIDRMIMCAFLGLTEKDLHSPAPYVRVLALNDKGREILRKARQNGDFPNIGEKVDHPYQNIENRCDDLYELFLVNSPENLTTKNRRISYKKTDIS